MVAVTAIGDRLHFPPATGTGEGGVFRVFTHGRIFSMRQGLTLAVRLVSILVARRTRTCQA
ncbi:MAG: hypothetical protein Fur0018_20210 [Anaerolineales bacterium]